MSDWVGALEGYTWTYYSDFVALRSARECTKIMHFETKSKKKLSNKKHCSLRQWGYDTPLHTSLLTPTYKKRVYAAAQCSNTIVIGYFKGTNINRALRFRRDLISMTLTTE